MGTWKVIFSTVSPHEAEVVRSMLEAHDIHAVVMDQRSSPYPHVGETELQVPQDDVMRALYLVRKHREA
jgi:type III secretory pathway lipoprotein EscJ